MQVLVASLGIIVFSMGAFCFASPTGFQRLLNIMQRGRRLYLAILFRVVAGAILIAAADACRFPGFVRVLGILFVVFALLSAFLGLKRLRSIAQWWSRRSPVIVRAWAVAAVGFGALLIYLGI